MKAAVGGGWVITHLTDRVVILRKDDVAYRRLTGDDGIVVCRSQPGMDRQEMISQAVKQARKSDAELANKAASDVLPTGRQWQDYRDKIRALRGITVTPEEPEVIGVKRV
jgi:hypothetical protein